MNEVPTILIGLLTLYAVLCGTLGPLPGAPLWLRWPLPIWNRIAHDWRTPAAVPARPDYAKIALLERELGLVEEQPVRRQASICLTKDCMGDTQELRTWSGQLLARVHHCDDASR
ncbi:hypothetical protein [Streptomyces phaeochromogenes]|uniref:hypothetical protein n=1 Tax=Streptomyces phaeochromogenes TaxID=1923 RepID=UPI002DDB06E8|nr:hypothetical protein [Streptomyces phaeochromogenes]WRZ30206.1 hypothetical protein OG931_21875 [Streptomyces phaeochromogenes]